MSDIARLIERSRQARDARAERIATERRRPSPASDRPHDAPADGTRVLDTITGQEGEIVGYGRQNFVGSTTQRADR